jgi:hypothetical protein
MWSCREGERVKDGEEEPFSYWSNNDKGPFTHLYPEARGYSETVTPFPLNSLGSGETDLTYWVSCREDGVEKDIAASFEAGSFSWYNPDSEYVTIKSEPPINYLQSEQWILPTDSDWDFTETVVPDMEAINSAGKVMDHKGKSRCGKMVIKNIPFEKQRIPLLFWKVFDGAARISDFLSPQMVAATYGLASAVVCWGRSGRTDINIFWVEPASLNHEN